MVSAAAAVGSQACRSGWYWQDDVTPLCITPRSIRSSYTCDAESLLSCEGRFRGGVDATRYPPPELKMCRWPAYVG